MQNNYTVLPSCIPLSYAILNYGAEEDKRLSVLKVYTILTNLQAWSISQYELKLFPEVIENYNRSNRPVIREVLRELAYHAFGSVDQKIERMHYEKKDGELISFKVLDTLDNIEYFREDLVELPLDFKENFIKEIKKQVETQSRVSLIPSFGILTEDAEILLEK